MMLPVVSLLAFVSTLIPVVASVEAPASKINAIETEPSVSANQYLQYRTISELVAQRPFGKHKKPAAEFSEAFAKHEDVRNIDLHQKEEAKLAQDLSRLRDPHQSPGWQRKLTLTLQKHLANAKVDPKKIDVILGYQYGQRLKKHSSERSARQAKDAKAILEDKQRHKDLYQKNKGKREETKRISGQFFLEMDQWIQIQSKTGKVSAIDVVKQAETLRPAFIPGREMAYYKALKLYLQKMKYSKEEIFLAQSVQSRQLMKIRTNKYKAQASRNYFSARGSTSSSRTKKKSAKTSEERPMKKVKTEQLGQSPSQVASTSSTTGPPLRRIMSSAHEQALTGKSDHLEKKIVMSGDPAKSGQASSSRSGEGGENVNELEAGPWWEGGYFEDGK